jgi:hypothetical protein
VHGVLRELEIFAKNMGLVLQSSERTWIELKGRVEVGQGALWIAG